MPHPRKELKEILREEREILHDDREILHELEEVEHEINHPNVTGFTPIKETEMVPLAAGQTATFSTTPLPAGTAPDPTKITWSSSDTTNAPVVVNPNDPSGLSAQVAFPSTTPSGLTFVLTINYINADGNAASQANSFVTVAPPPSDITGFTDIVQSA
jgi:hypothetical protein